MKEYEFTLKFSLTERLNNPDAYIEKLGIEGCDDALIGLGQSGRIALNFTRESSSAYDAIRSALEDVKRAIPSAKLVEATPDFVGLTEIADILGLTRQKLVMVSSSSAFPAPIHEGNPAIWHLSKVLVWLKERNKYQIKDTLIDIAKVNMQFNLAKEVHELVPAFQGEKGGFPFSGSYFT